MMRKMLAVGLLIVAGVLAFRRSRAGCASFRGTIDVSMFVPAGPTG
jgi:hypothetical protein